MSESVCQSRGCKYDVKAAGTPACTFQGYRLEVVEVTTTDLGFTAKLNQIGSAPYGGDGLNWIFRFENRGDYVARFTVSGNLFDIGLFKLFVELVS